MLYSRPQATIVQRLTSAPNLRKVVAMLEITCQGSEVEIVPVDDCLVLCITDDSGIAVNIPLSDHALKTLCETALASAA
jgi:hypothetical protein